MGSENQTLSVVVHNLGCKPSGPFRVDVRDARGKTLATQRHGGLDGVADLMDKKVTLRFPNLPAGGALQVVVRGPGKEITEVNNTAAIAAP